MSTEKDRELFRGFKCKCAECESGLHHNVEAAYQQGREDEAVSIEYAKQGEREMLKRFYDNLWEKGVTFRIGAGADKLTYKVIDEFLEQEESK